MVKENFPSVVIIENNSNVGFSKGNNLAVKLAKGEYVCMLNPDTVVAEDVCKYSRICKQNPTWNYWLSVG